ncbi:extracellular catalytic domain type 1 short-chain-length polyhydroxyalkanoate depolymerase [Mesorhizobium silamurunense]|uniref:extracellular catalytic domain type 1 short-chain-length polyhydroxyalkanoate depolymerase n=1 Tax=Mesorhizobium silamurunense TaxID=499528 RepID=UPI00177F6FD3|nr:PHB depolymerase family esterase [Mesorhizobium silamurunense]
MRKISDTIARLAALQGHYANNTAEHGGRSHLQTLASFGSDPGGLNARYYLPANLSESAPLVVVLHGCTQNAYAYNRYSGWSQLADQLGFGLVFPEQKRANNSNLCFNWFQPADSRRGSGEALSIRQMIETMVVEHGLDRERIFITGLSAGGAMASAMLATYPEVFAGGAIIAGLAHGSASTIPEAFDRMRGHGGPSKAALQQLLREASPHEGPWPTISIWQGTADNTVVPSNADAILAQWQGVHDVGTRPLRTENVDGQRRQVWCDDNGRELIEKYMIAGMGHGTPLKTSGNDCLGSAGPFMLDVGISSTRHIAHFWGLAKPTMWRPVKTEAVSGTAMRSFTPAEELRLVHFDPTPEPLAPNSRASASGITKVIEDALRAAGLMR